jgi:hypothetical protein
MAPWHKALVDCLILDALHSYGQDSLSPKALIRMWQVPLPCYRVEIRDLPVVLQENTFVQTLTREAPEWKLLLPTGVKLEVKDVGGERIWSLLHRRYGRIVVRCLRHYWAADYDQKIGRALGEGLQPSQRRWFWVLGSRAEARASFRLAFLPRADSFHEWATGLLAYLEEELDWGYFERSRPDRMVVDLPWKIGDLPDNASVWGKLMDIETRLMQLETEIMAKAPPNSLPDDPSRPPFPRLTKA